MNKAVALTTASSLALAGVVLAAPAAQAKDDQVRSRGTCVSSTPTTAVATWALKIKDRKGGLRADFTVKTDTVGQEWKLTLTQGGAPVALATKTTVASDDRSRSTSRAAVRDRGHGDDDGVGHDGVLHDADDDRVTGVDADDDGPNHDANDDRVTGVDGSHDAQGDDAQGDDNSAASTSRSGRSSSHVAEVKFRNVLDANATALVFTATSGDWTCTAAAL